ncbi:MAG: three-helix bundle dimerization domain-containing protein [Mycobacterium sp.]
MAVVSEQVGIGNLVDQLQVRYPGLSRDVVDAVVRAEHSRFADSPLRDYVPLLVERRAREELGLLGI